MAKIRASIPSGGVVLADLLASLREGFTKTDVFLAILRTDVHVLLEHCLLSDHRLTRLFSEKHHAEVHRLLHFETKPTAVSPLILEPGTEIRWNGALYSVCNASPEKIYIRTDAGMPTPIPRDLLNSLLRSGEAEIVGVPILMSGSPGEGESLGEWLSPDRIARGVAKQQFLAFRVHEPRTRPAHFGLKATVRTIQRWCQDARESLARYGTSFWGLLDKPRPGRPRDELPAEMREDMTKFANELYFVPTAPKLKYVWRALRESRKARNLDYPSEGAFRRHVEEMKNAHDATKARKGKKQAYK